MPSFTTEDTSSENTATSQQPDETELQEDVPSLSSSAYALNQRSFAVSLPQRANSTSSHIWSKKSNRSSFEGPRQDVWKSSNIASHIPACWINTSKASSLAAESPISPSTSEGFRGKYDEVFDDSTSTGSSYSGRTLQKLEGHKKPRACQELEQKINELLPYPKRCPGGSVRYTGPDWHGARISQWEGEGNAICRDYLARKGWRPRRGKIRLTVKINHIQELIEFIVVENCPAELLIGLRDQHLFKGFQEVQQPLSPSRTPDTAPDPPTASPSDQSPTPRQTTNSRGFEQSWHEVSIEAAGPRTKFTIKTNTHSTTGPSTQKENTPSNGDGTSNTSMAIGSDRSLSRHLTVLEMCFIACTVFVILNYLVDILHELFRSIVECIYLTVRLGIVLAGLSFLLNILSLKDAEMIFTFAKEIHQRRWNTASAQDEQRDRER